MKQGTLIGLSDGLFKQANMRAMHTRDFLDLLTGKKNNYPVLPKKPRHNTRKAEEK